MANGHGGQRTPSNPAPASGPGALSQRTDGGVADGQGNMQLPNADYGEQQSFQRQQSQAPMAGGGSPGGSTGAPRQGLGPPVDASGVTPMNAGTQRPGGSVLDGATLEEAARRNSAEDLRMTRAWLPYLKFISSQPNAPQALRQMVRQAEGDTRSLS